MPVNRNALIRYRTLDNCLRNRFRQWTLDDLIEACSEALYEYEGIDKGVSRRTVQMDIQMMRSDKLGYNAPIMVVDKKYYIYEDPDYSITNIPLTDQDLNKLTEVADILRQFKGFTHFNELNGMVQRLEDRIHTAKTKQAPIIDLEKNENLKGLEHIDMLYQAILNKRALDITYQSFKARQASTFAFHPYLLKEYRNRWFVLGVKKASQPVLTLALDRIVKLENASQAYVENKNIDLSRYFSEVVGVTVNSGDPVEEVELFVDDYNAPYVLTKPIHHSQELIEKGRNGIVIRLQVKHNFELEREILGYGECMKVLKPERLKRRIQEKFRNAYELYDKEIKLSELGSSLKKLKRQGSAVLENIYTQKETGRILSTVTRYLEQKAELEAKPRYAIRNLLQELPRLRSILFNQNLITLIEKGFGEGYFLTKAIYFDKPPEANWYVTYHQDLPINVKEKKETEGYTGWTQKEEITSVVPPQWVLKNGFTIRIHLDDTDEHNGALKIVPRSHTAIHSKEEISALRDKFDSKVVKVNKGGIHLMKPLTVHASAKNETPKPRRVIHLEFNNAKLANGLEWLEKLEF